MAEEQDMAETGQRKHSRRGIYLLPNLFTTAALFAGFYAIVAGMADRFEAAAIAIVIAGVLDGVDGWVARLTNTQSAFGAEYDSLADLVSFGLAPSLVVYQWSLVNLGKLGWLAAFLYAASTALRLARYNTQAGIADKRYFQGLPSPAAAGAMACMVWVFADNGVAGNEVVTLALGVTVFAGVLMVSNVRYHSLKAIDFRGRVPFEAVLMVVVLFLVVFTDPPVVLFSVGIIYGTSGPLLTLLHIRKRRAERSAPESPDE
ncbi:MAG: CDP-diacylglycerol--serine O-phosphatidyltransferase [Gammaproteobacteria bacterium]|nr:MAG: CDP-diacylglycerol--serine O-phosphatidyltransferase [Gammaproteobacteria bacterium]